MNINSKLKFLMNIKLKIDIFTVVIGKSYVATSILLSIYLIFVK